MHGVLYWKLWGAGGQQKGGPSPDSGGASARSLVKDVAAAGEHTRFALIEVAERWRRHQGHSPDSASVSARMHVRDATVVRHKQGVLCLK